MEFSRRTVLALGASAFVAACSASDQSGKPTPTTEYDPLPRPALTGAEPYSGAFPFTLGVAAGDPDPHRVVLWTRLVPDPLASNGGMDSRSYVVTWEVALDEEFAEVAFVGDTVAEARFGHSVHVDVTELEPAVSFWYRFRAGPHVSPVGRMAALPLFTMPDVVTVAALTAGPPATHAAVYQDIAEAAPDLTVVAGDIVDSSTGEGLADRRVLYTRSLLNPELQSARAASPWLVAYDARLVIEDAAAQAWWENMPARLPPPSLGGRLTAYRHCVVGSLVDVIVLAPRVRGSGQASLGKEQERWLAREAAETKVVWHAMAGAHDSKLSERADTVLANGGAANPISLDPEDTADARPHWDRHVFTPETWTTSRRSVDAASGAVVSTDGATVRANGGTPNT